MISSAHPKQTLQLRRAFLVGMLGGVVGSAAKLVGEALIPPRKPGEEPPPALVAEKLLQRSLSKGQKTVATQLFHWSFGAVLGGVYSAAAQRYPQVTCGYGAAFGWTVMLLTHESSLPALGVSPAPWNQGPKELISEFITHAMYGMSTEAVRRWFVTKGLLSQSSLK